MTDYLFAIWANRNTCKPYTGAGRVGHVVRVVVPPTTHITIINEFTTVPADLSHVACGPSSLQSWFLDKTSVRTSIGEIETLAGTSFPNGTGFLGLQRAVEHFGGKAALSETAFRGTIMNPGGGYLDADFAAYLAARQHGADVLLLTPPPGPPPTPTPPPPVYNGGEDMALRQFVAKTVAPPVGTGGNAVFISNGMQFRHVVSAADEQGVSATGPWFNGDGKPLLMWNGGAPVADVYAFGTPANKHTADILGLPFP